MLEKINTWLVRCFAIFWSLFIFIDYLNYTGYVGNALHNIEYMDLLLVSLILTIVAAYFNSVRRQKWWLFEFKNFRNIYWYLALLVFMVLIMGFYLSKTELVDSIGSAIILFLIKCIGIHLGLALIVFASYAAGIQILKRLPLRLFNYSKPLVAIALGLAMITMLLFIVGAIGFLNMFSVVAIILGAFAISYKEVLSLFKSKLLAKNKKFEINILGLIPAAVLLFCVALSLISAMRPLPTGFDSLTLYMNIPKLIAGYGALVEGGQAYNWSIIMSLGFVLFKSTAMAITLSTLPGVLSILVIYRISINIVSREWSLFACAVFYTFPNVIFQSRYDAKVDLAMLFVILTAVLLAFEHYYANKKFPQFKKIKPLVSDPGIALWAVCGLLMGFAFGIKYTALFSVLVFMIWLFYVSTGKWGALGMFFLNFAIVFGLKLNQFSNLEVSADKLPLLIGVPSVIALFFFAMMFRENKDKLTAVSKNILVFGAMIGVMFAPWVAKNLSENKKISIDAVINGKNPLPPLKFAHSFDRDELQKNLTKKEFLIEEDPLAINHAGIFSSIDLDLTSNDLSTLFIQQEPEEGGSSNEDNVVEGNTAKYEEVNRYIGYEDGLIKFLSLPYDLTMKRNVNLWGIDMGLLFMLLLPLLVFSFRKKQLHWNILKMVLLTMLLVVSIVSVESRSGTFDLQASLENLRVNSFVESDFFASVFGGLYVLLKGSLLKIGDAIMPLYNSLTVQTVELSFLIIIMSSVVLYFIYHGTLKDKAKKSKAIILFSFATIFLWIILGSGIIWYGIVGFALLPILFGIFFAEREDSDQDSFMKGLTIVFGGLWFVIIMPFQLAPIQMTMVSYNMDKINFNYFLERPFGLYSVNKLKEKDAFQAFYGKVDNNIITTLNNNEDAKILNVYTSLKYHISNNDIRVYEDNQLQKFNAVWNATEGDKLKTVEQLKSIGIKYILISLATPNMDNTPERTLNRKFNNLMNTLINNKGARLLYTNRLVERHDGDREVVFEGKKVKVKYELAGLRVVEVGTVALYEIL